MLKRSLGAAVAWGLPLSVLAFGCVAAPHTLQDHEAQLRSLAQRLDYVEGQARSHANLFRVREARIVELEARVTELEAEAAEAAPVSVPATDTEPPAAATLPASAPASAPASPAEPRGGLDLSADDYLEQYVMITNLRFERGRSYVRGEGMGILGTVINNGGRTLDKVLLRAYLLDDRGQPIAEDEYHAVLHLREGFAMDKSYPLRPGYRKDFGWIPNAPAGWSEKAKVKVVQVEFAKDED